MEFKKTDRGFDIAEFRDRYNDKCSLQESSLASEDCIWLGISPVDHQQGPPWKPFVLPIDVQCSSRMHLTRDMVKDLLPYLIRFVETGSLTD